MDFVREKISLLSGVSPVAARFTMIWERQSDSYPNYGKTG